MKKNIRLDLAAEAIARLGKRSLLSREPPPAVVEAEDAIMADHRLAMLRHIAGEGPRPEIDPALEARVHARQPPATHAEAVAALERLLGPFPRQS